MFIFDKICCLNFRFIILNEGKTIFSVKSHTFFRFKILFFKNKYIYIYLININIIIIIIEKSKEIKLFNKGCLFVNLIELITHRK